MRRLFFLIFLFTGCTSVGFHDAALRQRLIEHSAPPMTVKLCAYLDDGISEQEAQELLDAAWNPDEEQVGVSWIIAATSHVPRPAFTYFAMKAVVDSWSVPDTCDRVMFFMGRHAGDVVFGVVAMFVGIPEVLGYVDDHELTRGYIVAQRATVNQLFISPSAALRHELYHMLGCEHSWSLANCYAAIAELRRLAGLVHYVPGRGPEARRAVRLPGR